MPGPARLSALLLPCALAGGALAGCGGAAIHARPAPVTGQRTETARSPFPAGDGAALARLRAQVRGGPRLATTVSVLRPGENRVGFVLVDRAERAVAGTRAALYVAAPGGGGVRGPYMARDESLRVPERYASRAPHPGAAATKRLYVVDGLRFDRPGARELTAVVRLGGRLVATRPARVVVGTASAGGPPAVGSLAPRVHTPTAASVHGNLAAIDTRVPHDDLHREDLADVLGHEPVVLVFGAPGMCRGHLCPDVVDVVEAVAAAHRGDAAFIHMELYRGNDPAQGLRPQAVAYGVGATPWTFVIDRTGRIAARFEGPLSPAELEHALAGVTTG